MQMHYCYIESGNFGDDLNTQLWPRLFPDLASENREFCFYGIGTILDGVPPTRRKKVVLGSGIGERGVAHRHANWDFRWARGPLTADEFGLPRALGLGDPALLWPGLLPRVPVQTGAPIGLIPQYQTWDSFDWDMVAARAGLLAINPHQAPEQVLTQMRSCSRILTESLHGGICADAMAIPWAPCVLAHRFNDFKWHDWLATIGREFTPLVTDRPLVQALCGAKQLANRLARSTGYKAQTRRPALRAVRVATAEDVQCVAQQLHDFAARQEHFTCSPLHAIAQQRERMLEACSRFAVDYALRFTPH